MSADRSVTGAPPRELSDVERAKMESAFQVEVKRAVECGSAGTARDVFEAGYRAALAAREDAPGRFSVREVEAMLEAAHQEHDELPLTIEAATRLAEEMLDGPIGVAHGVEGLPGDGQRPDKYEDSRIANACADAVAQFRHVGLEPAPLVVGGLAVDILRGRTPPVVRDTEREHEPAPDNEREWTLQAYSDDAPLIGGSALAEDEEIVVVPKTRATAAERHAEVLAKALDQFLGKPNLIYTMAEVEHRAAELRASVEPTLRALGYPKEETT